MTTAGMSRFVLFSAALHLGVLAALGLDAARPQFFPTTLTIALNENSETSAAAPHHHGAHESWAADGANTARKVIKPSRRPNPIKDTAQETAQIDSSSTLPPQTRDGDPGANDLSATSPSDQPTPSQFPLSPRERAGVRDRSETSPLEDSSRSAGQNEGDGTMAAAQHTHDLQQRATDASMLSSRLESQLRDALAPYFSYPLMARRNGWQGQVQVGLRVEADGHLSHVRIAHSSGYRLLDSAALTTLQRIDALPKAAGWLDGQHFDMVLPIEYRLIGDQS